MKVIVQGDSAENLTVTFFITSAEEKASFHDRAAITLCQGPDKFLAKIYAPERYEDGEYEISIKPPIA